MNIQFKIGEVQYEDNLSIPALTKVIKELKFMLYNLHYSGALSNKNSRQLNIDFDHVLLSKLSDNNWTLEKKPKLNMTDLCGDLGNPEADLIISHKGLDGMKTVVEIEKGNKKTIWFDFIKMWMFIEAKKANLGVLICPINYAHKHAVWNLFDEALKYKEYLRRFAGVPENKMNSIGIIGYQQTIKNGSKYNFWDEKEFNRIKMTD